MEIEKKHEDIEITLDAFKESNWRDAIKDTGEHGYASYWQSFSKYSRIATEDGNHEKAKILRLIADACSMMMKPDSMNNSFGPAMVMQGKRSAILEDFSKNDLSLFNEILPEIDDFRLKARIADILWIAQKPRNVEYAFAAIDSYMQFPLDPDSTLKDGKDAWRRAIKLCQILNIKSSDRIINIQNTIFAKFEEAIIEDKFHVLRLSDLLYDAGIDESRSKVISEKLEICAEKSKEINDWDCARHYYESVCRWNKKLNKDTIINKIYTNIAETWVAEAEQRLSGSNPSNMVAAHFFENAIQTYRKIPREKRNEYGAEERLKEIHQKMEYSNQLSLGEMQSIEMPGIDISKTVEASRNYVAGRNFPEVLLALANIHPKIEEKQVRDNAKKIMSQSLLHHLCSSVRLTKDGRVAAKSLGINLDNSDSAETKQALWHEMINSYCIDISLIVQANILPALRVIWLEHSMSISSLLSLCHCAPIIPLGREEFWAKGLFYGFDGDFAVATHLLIPQLEHFVRFFMKQNGIKTTSLDSLGIETENGLSSLLEKDDIESVFGEDLAFEFRALLSDSYGPNMRNNVAHGLLEAEDVASTNAIYLWWLSLRLIMNSISWSKPKEDNCGNNEGNEKYENI